MIRLHFLIISVAILCHVGWAQYPEVIKYKEKDGLKSLRSNQHLFQDSQNFMWICSLEGLIRYDGTEFVRYAVPDAPGFIPIKLTESVPGKIWVLSANGNLAYSKNNAFHFYPVKKEIANLIKNRQVQQFETDEFDNLYFGTKKNGLIKIDSSGRMHHLISNRNGSGLGIWFSNTVRPMAFGTSIGKEWRLADTIRVFNNDLVCTNQSYFDFENQSPDYKISLFEDRDETVALGFGDFIFRISEEKGIEHYCSIPDAVMSICVDNYGNWIVGTMFSGIMLSPGGHLNRIQLMRYFDGESIISMTKDSNGSIWFSVLQEGIWQMPSINVLRYKTDNSKLNNNVLRHFYTTKDHVYFTTNDNKIYQSKPDTFPEVQFFDMTKGVLRGLLSRPWEDKSTGKTYIAYGQRIGYLKNDEFKELDIKVPPEMGANANFLTFSSDGNDGIWAFGRSGGIHIKADTIVAHSFKKGAYISNSVFYNNKIFLSGVKGLQELKDQKFKKIDHPHPIFRSTITSLLTHQNKMWISSRPYGLAFLEQDSLHLISQEFGLYDVWKLYVDHDTIWGLDNGHLIKIIDAPHQKIEVKKYWINFSKELIYRDFILHNGTFYLSSNEGLVTVKKSELDDLHALPSSRITTVQIHGKDTLLKPAYELNHTQDMIQIGFNGIHFGSPDKQYKYRMSGVDHDWKYTKNTSIQYTKLTPGSYEFEVYAISGEGIISKESAKLSFTIVPPYWKTIWFWSLVSLIGLSIIFMVIRNRFKRVVHQKRINEKLYNLESQALRSQMNPHFIFNILSVIQGYVLKSDVESSEKYLAKFSKLIRLILENSREDFVVFEAEIEMLRYYMDMEKMRFDNHFSYDIKIDPLIDTESLKIPPMIIQPYVENAIIHGFEHLKKDGEIDIIFTLEDNILQCEIIDNGINMSETKTENIKIKNQQSLGLLITKERLSLLKDTSAEDLMIRVDNNREEGTHVFLEIPFKLS